MYLNKKEVEVITRLAENSSEEDKKVIKRLIEKSNNQQASKRKCFTEDDYQRQNYNINRKISYYRKQRNFEKIAELEAQKIELKRKYKNV